MKLTLRSRNLVFRRLARASCLLFCVSLLAVFLALWIPQLPILTSHSKLHPSLVAFGDLPISEEEPAALDLVGTLDPSDSVSNEPTEQTCETGATSRRHWLGLCGKGRVKSVEDFRKAVSKDPLLRSYYDGFRWDRAKMFELESPVEAYLNYKRDGRILRTRKKVTLPKGDTILTDGARSVRAYCCNELVLELDDPLSLTPAPLDPQDLGGSSLNRSLGADSEDLGLVQDPPEPEPRGYIDPSMAAFYRSVTGPFPTVVDPPGPGGNDPTPPMNPDLPPVDPFIPVPPDPPPAPVPEPSTLLLFTAGLGGLLAALRRKGPARTPPFQGSRSKESPV